MRAFTPDFSISADGNDLTAAIRDRLLRLTIADQSGNTSDSVKIVLDDRDHAIRLPRTGAELAISLGYKENGLIDMGKWTVDEIELSGPPDTLIISAKAANTSTRNTKSGKADTLRSVKTRAWDNIAIADICKTIANEHGYTPRIADKYATGSPPAIGAPVTHLDQREESDLNFLTRLAKDYGAVCKPVRDYLLFVEKGTPVSATGRVLDSISLTPKDMTSWRATLADRGKYVAAIAHYHDHATAKRIPVRAGKPSGVPVTSVTGTFADEQSARAAATARLASLNRGATTLSLTMPGNALIASGSPLALIGFRDGSNGTYHATSVTHTLDAGGYKLNMEGKMAAGNFRAL